MHKTFFDTCCGMNIQYNPEITEGHVVKMRNELEILFGKEKFFLAMWSTRKRHIEIDSFKNLKNFALLLNAVNTDLPQNFWRAE